MNDSPIYLDNQSTTQLAPEVFEEMTPYMTAQWGNASANHYYGIRMKKALDRARVVIASSIGADADEIIFTSGSTESINTVIRSLYKSMHLECGATEHKAVIEACLQAKRNNGSASFLQPKEKSGHISLEELEKKMSNTKSLVCLMHGNNEIGTIHPIKNISKIVHKHGGLLLTDGAQAFGKIPVNVKDLGVDFYTMSSHKMYGPIGVGALYVKREHKALIEPLLQGGGQENGYRSGTENIAAIVGFAAACTLIHDNIEEDSRRINDLTHQFLNHLEKEFYDIQINGCELNKLPGNINLTIPDVESDLLLNRLADKLCISKGSSCNTFNQRPSHVLLALGLSPAEANNSIRISIGRYNTAEEIEFASQILIDEIKLIKEIFAYGTAG